MEADNFISKMAPGLVGEVQNSYWSLHGIPVVRASLLLTSHSLVPLENEGDPRVLCHWVSCLLEPSPSLIQHSSCSTLTGHLLCAQSQAGQVQASCL